MQPLMNAATMDERGGVGIVQPLMNAATADEHGFLLLAMIAASLLVPLRAARRTFASTYNDLRQSVSICVHLRLPCRAARRTFASTYNDLRQSVPICVHLRLQ